MDDEAKKSGQEIPLEVTSLGSDSKQADAPAISNQHVTVAEEGDQNYLVAEPLFPSGLGKDMPQGVPLAISSVQAAKEVCELQGKIPYHKSRREFGSSSTNSSRGVHASKVKPSTYVVNRSNCRVVLNPSRVWTTDQYDVLEEETSDIPMVFPLQQGNSSQFAEDVLQNKPNHSSAKEDSTEEESNSDKSPAVTVAVPGLPYIETDATRSKLANRVRRGKITDGLKALQEFLPHSGKGGKEAVMDDIIDYIKYLQLHIKVLSQSRLGGEPTGDPFVYFEGFGHYLFHDQMLKEPLEEVIGQLMEINMPAVTQLLESKGLTVMPMSFAEGLSKPW